MEETHFIGFLSKLLETKLLQILRFKHGQVCKSFAVLLYVHYFVLWPNIYLGSYICLKIYSTGVSVFLGGNKPSSDGNVRGDVSVNFSCKPDISSNLVSSLCAFLVVMLMHLCFQ